MVYTVLQEILQSASLKTMWSRGAHATFLQLAECAHARVVNPKGVGLHAVRYYPWAAVTCDGDSNRNRGHAKRFVRAEKVAATAGETAPVRDADPQTRGRTAQEGHPDSINSETRERTAASSS